MDKLRSKILPLILVMVLLGAGLAVFSASSPALASGGFGWQSWSTGDIESPNVNNGIPYWNGASLDGGNQNIGDILSGANSNSYLTPPRPGAMDYWGNSTGNADPDIFFSSVGGGILFGISGDVDVKVVLAGNADSNIFGWYNLTDPSTLNPILTGAKEGDTASFTPSAKFGLYFIGYNGGDTWYSNAALNGAGEQSDQHFAIFKDLSGNLWVCCEDLRLSESDRDYQDLVIEITPRGTPPLPEASTIVMFSLGLVVLGGFVGYGIHRRRATA